MAEAISDVTFLESAKARVVVEASAGAAVELDGEA
jgi:hypothetical protein